MFHGHEKTHVNFSKISMSMDRKKNEVVIKKEVMK
jgi:hypothetical protein